MIHPQTSQFTVYNMNSNTNEEKDIYDLFVGIAKGFQDNWYDCSFIGDEIEVYQGADGFFRLIHKSLGIEGFMLNQFSGISFVCKTPMNLRLLSRYLREFDHYLSRFPDNMAFEYLKKYL